MTFKLWAGILMIRKANNGLVQPGHFDGCIPNWQGEFQVFAYNEHGQRVSHECKVTSIANHDGERNIAVWDGTYLKCKLWDEVM